MVVLVVQKAGKEVVEPVVLKKKQAGSGLVSSASRAA